jgi:hypothetical protein
MHFSTLFSNFIAIIFHGFVLISALSGTTVVAAIRSTVSNSINTNQLVNVYPDFMIIQPKHTTIQRYTDHYGRLSYIRFVDKNDLIVRSASIEHIEGTDYVRRISFVDTQPYHSPRVGEVCIGYAPFHKTPISYNITTLNGETEEIHLSRGVLGRIHKITVTRASGHLVHSIKTKFPRHLWTGKSKDICIVEAN